jgi:GNAT superfamily N-acetyltransferase
MTLQIAPLAQAHLEDAAALVSQRYRALCAEAPALPAQFAKQDVILAKLAELTTTAPGVVALRNGKLVGFLAAMLLPSFRGRRGVYCPEWANGAHLEDANAIYQELYRAIAGDWVRNGYLLHGLTLFANDRQGLAAWHWQGFGMIVADAIRDLAPVAGADVAVEFRQVSAADMANLRPLHLGLRRHLASAPIFLPLQEKWDQAREQAWLEEAGATNWLARVDGQPAAWMRAQIGDDGAGELVRDAATVAITGAYTVPAIRSSGVATALLQTVIDYAEDNGATRLSVDYETQNIDGARFWLRHFQPVSFSLLRQVDERILWAHADREESAYW